MRDSCLAPLVGTVWRSASIKPFIQAVYLDAIRRNQPILLIVKTKSLVPQEGQHTNTAFVNITINMTQG